MNKITTRSPLEPEYQPLGKPHHALQACVDFEQALLHNNKGNCHPKEESLKPVRPHDLGKKEGQKGDGLRAHAPLAATSQPGRKEVGLKPQHNHQNNHDFNLSPLAEGATNRAHLYQQDSRFDDRVESIINALMPLAPFLEGVTCETGTSSESPCEPSGHDELFVQQSPIDSAQPVQLNTKPTVQPLNPAADGAEVIVWSVGRETPASIAKNQRDSRQKRLAEEPLALHQKALPEICPPAVSATPDDHLVARWCATPVTEVAEKSARFPYKATVQSEQLDMTELADRSQHLTDGVDSSKDTIEPPRPEELLLPREETLPEMYSLSFTAPVVTPGDHLLATMRATRLASVSEQLIQLAQRLAVELELRGGSSQVTQLHLNLPELGAIMVRIAEIPGKLHVELIASREALRILAQGSYDLLERLQRIEPTQLDFQASDDSEQESRQKRHVYEEWEAEE
ncbi:type III secretion system needle length determinant (plasmid) [Yersinia pseudotuberculosis IP 32953]|uniref:Yop proteins translocation protein P n=1 Tax=Yersinia pseudotuberculosis serotype I (strain IP32953) TaxID=273123 RepID=YSCP_YERPS|nr:type III secretion system needle length determinant YscP [Yersinia pseudotuberculosis]Q663J7.2 RecName: Full=Yop proteins translocation protein P [Yersinia pseudotuberculosis IP 32953]CQD58693.1 type III secretion system needle length determinant YscP [Yersinia intermedia]AJJ53153.1 type III secretion system needle length determinant [Yersinia pseudotuberculosis IP 32953]AJJ65303.1 type III secretion system needle length determinant [Yersinia pseudotuberculosis PB1/+]AYX13718.1 translocatio